ncbi:hypothetical protein OIU77_026458 [Salix suchowensis]|uniref:Ataxin-2 C-terminal domain-containing protein n=1 Tax=Salix suchowensis TaxID=1278906 RepID=A0ABQ9BL71_9ROSI|nr:hypothetical protein OIU77_026458 [Salix suchowensis]
MATSISGRTTLNPNAPLFIPNVYRQVEDFSPEWWELVKTSTWFRDFWLSQHPEESFDGNAGADDDDLADFLPEDLDVEEEIPNLEAQFEEMIKLAEAEEKTDSSAADPKVEGRPLNGIVSYNGRENFAQGPKSFQNLPRKEVQDLQETLTKYQMKPPHCVAAKRTALHIHQPSLKEMLDSFKVAFVATSLTVSILAFSCLCTCKVVPFFVSFLVQVHV